jgi:predicted amidophosphoribosyltransferase
LINYSSIRIPGRWRQGFALDLHTTDSTYLGDDEHSNPRFQTNRSEIGELLYKAKYHADKSVIPAIAEAAGSFVESFLPAMDLIVAVPPSTPRREQPLMLIARALAAKINVSISEDCVWKIRETPALKNAYDYDQRWRLLDGAFDVDQSLVAGKTLLLFDDLYRSGATMNAITSALYDKGGAKDIFALTLTRTRSRQ